MMEMQVVMITQPRHFKKITQVIVTIIKLKTQREIEMKITPNPDP